MAEPVRRVAFLGLGIMGAPMASNLASAGFEVNVWNRTRERAEEVARGTDIQVCTWPDEAASYSDVTITMVVDSPQVEEVLFGGEHGAAKGMDPGHIAVDMSTIAPTAAIAIGERLAERAVTLIDAPVTGSRPKAESATLTIMAGGDEAAFGLVRPVLEAMGQLVLRVGPAGHGQMVKLINNTLAAINAAALAEALTAAGADGLDTEALLKVIAAGSGASAMLDLKARPMLDRDLDPLFKLEHMLKDVRHCLAEARALGVELPLAERAERLYANAAESGLGERDFAAVIEAIDVRK
jgi:3-hydroxyisobutyrate dehydrogenase-like beta-hydroxyacid dehydrogenase